MAELHRRGGVVWIELQCQLVVAARHVAQREWRGREVRRHRDDLLEHRALLRELVPCGVCAREHHVCARRIRILLDEALREVELRAGG